MPIHNECLSTLLVVTVLSFPLAAPLPAQAQSGAGNQPVLTYPPYERTGGDSGDPFAGPGQSGTGACQVQYGIETRQIDSDHQAGVRNCRFPGNGACHAANNSEKGSRLRAAGQQLRQCNQQAQAQQQRGGQTSRRPAESRPAPGDTQRIDDQAILRQQEAQLARERGQFDRGLAQARAQAEAAARAAAAARVQQEARRWAEAQQFVDVLTGRRAPFP